MTPDCIAVLDSTRCQNPFDHSGKHYALTMIDGKRRAVKWTDDETTHISLGTDSVPVTQVTQAARDYRMYLLQLQSLAITRNITLDEAEHLVQAEKERVLSGR